MPTDIIFKLIKGKGCAHFPWEAVPESSPIITKTVFMEISSRFWKH